ncbi:MAG: CHAD domain-containing protein [Verrucomicrobiales bacterium]|nr:CHAD domain-containing protein [Verrucomicrobiales bacterium]
MTKAVRRLGRERIEHALECLKECDRAEAIHCARKDIKKVRAVLRLVCTRIRKKDWCRLTDQLRQAAKQLAVPRDAYVKPRTLRNLIHHFKGQLAAGALRHVRTELRTACDEQMKEFTKEKTVQSVERTLRRAAKELDHLKVNGEDWKALCPGVKRAYSAGQHAYETVLKDPSPENFHEWRKRAKDLWYQVTLLRRLWPEQMDAMERELEALGEHLGDDHDLVMLRQAVEEKGASVGNPRELELLNGLIEERQRKLRTAALAVGSRFYAEKPSAFSNRLARYWQVWRGEKAPSLKSAETAA